MKRFVYILLFLFPLISFGQAKFYSKGKSATSTGSQYQVSFVLENGKGKNFKAPKFEGFNVLSGPNQSSSYQWVNGKTTSSISYYFILQAHTEGDVTIGAASITVDGKELKTKPFTVSIGKGVPVTKKEKEQVTQEDLDVDPSENIFVRLYADKTSPYVGEQVTVYAKLYQNVASYNTQVQELPTFNGFWKQEFELSPDRQWENVDINGNNYQSLLIGKYALFAQKDGTLTVEPFKISTVLRVQDPDYNPFDFSSFFKQRYQEMPYDFQSSSIQLNVQPLPKEGKPENFTGGVGVFQLSSSLDKSDMKTGEALTFKSKLSGTGNIMMVELPEPEFPRHFEQFDPQTNEYISKNATYVNGHKSGDYIMIPDNPGSYIIPSIEFSYFDIQAKEYKTIATERLTVRVTGEKLKNSNASDEIADIVDNELRYLQLDNDLRKNQASFMGSSTFYGLMAGMPLFTFFLLFARKKIAENAPDSIELKRKRAGKIAKAKLAKAAGLLKSADKEAYYKEVNASLWGYLGDKLKITSSDFRQSIIEDKLLQNGVQPKTITQLFELINKCEAALYSPMKLQEMEGDYKVAESIIIQIEEEFA